MSVLLTFLIVPYLFSFLRYPFKFIICTETFRRNSFYFSLHVNNCQKTTWLGALVTLFYDVVVGIQITVRNKSFNLFIAKNINVIVIKT